MSITKRKREFTIANFLKYSSKKREARKFQSEIYVSKIVRQRGNFNIALVRDILKSTMTLEMSSFELLRKGESRC